MARPGVRIAIVAVAAVVLTSGCGRDGGDVASSPTQASGPVPVARDRGPMVNSSAQPHAIPSAMIGTWGMNPADCDPSHGDDKGRMTVAADSLDFYEAHAQLAAVVSAGEDRIRAAFSFVGEGQNWTQEEELLLQSDGKSLIRRQIEGDPPAIIRYVRCPR